MKYLTQKDIEFYNQNGYILVDNVLSKEEIKELSDVTDTFVEKSKFLFEVKLIFLKILIFSSPFFSTGSKFQIVLLFFISC